MLVRRSFYTPTWIIRPLGSVPDTLHACVAKNLKSTDNVAARLMFQVEAYIHLGSKSSQP